MKENYYLLIGNGRTGSTWLHEMLNNLTDYLADYKIRSPSYEIKCLPVEYNLGPGHIPISKYDIRIKEKIKVNYEIVNLHNDIHKAHNLIFGAKLIFDPYQPTSADTIYEIQSYLDREKDVNLIWLYRDYYEMFLSWNCRGVFHVLNNEPRGIKDNLHIFLFNTPSVSKKDVLKKYEACTEPKRGMQYEEALEKIFIFFYHDLMIAKMFYELGRGRVIDYQNVNEELMNIAKYCGIEAPAEAINETLGNAPTLKLDSLYGLVYPEASLAVISYILKQKLKDIVDKKLDVNDVFHIDRDLKEIKIKDKDIKEIFGETARFYV